MGLEQTGKERSCIHRSIDPLSREICLHSGPPRLGQKITKGQLGWKPIKSLVFRFQHSILIFQCVTGDMALAIVKEDIDNFTESLPLAQDGTEDFPS